MTHRERATQSMSFQMGDTIYHMKGRLREAQIDAIEEAISAAVEEATKRLEDENGRMRTALEIFEDGANWDRYPGLRDLPIYEWCHDSDPRVLAQDACNKSDGGTK